MLPDGLFVVCLFCEYDGPLAVILLMIEFSTNIEYINFIIFIPWIHLKVLIFCDHNLKVSKTS